MTAKEKIIESISERIGNLDEDMLVELWNYYSSELCNNYDDCVYHNDDYFWDNNFECPSEAVRAMQYGSVDINDEWVKFDGYGNVESAYNACDLVDIEGMQGDAERLYDSMSESDLKYYFDMSTNDFEDDEEEEEEE